jgi:hypothetical protein
MQAIVRVPYVAPLVLMFASVVACSSSGEHIDEDLDAATVDNVSSDLTLMPKPGSVGSNTEAGRDIEQLGLYTLYGADGDDPEGDNAQRGSVHLFKSGAPLRSYRLNTAFPYTQFGNQVAISGNWVVATATAYPLGNQTYGTVLVVIGKNSAGEYQSCGSVTGGQVPSCITCSGDTCNPLPGVSVFSPIGFTPEELGSSPRLDVQGDEIFVSFGPSLITYKREGNAWAPFSGAYFDSNYTTDIAVDGDRLVIGHRSPYHTSGVVDVFERQPNGTAWTRKLRILPDDPDDITFGNSVDLSGDRLVIGTATDVHFFNLASGSLPIGDGLLEQCIATPEAEGTLVVAVSGERAIVAAGSHTATFKDDGNTWAFHGGLPNTIFPSDAGAQLGGGFWGAAIDGDRAAVGWRNYKGTPATGAAVGFAFDASNCGQLVQAGSQQVRALPLTIANASGASLANYPPSNAIDTNVDSSWAHAKTPGATLTLTLSELQTLGLLQINWGTGYARDYTVEVSENGSAWVQLQRVTHGDGLTNGSTSGLTDWLDLRSNQLAFGKQLRIVATSFSSAGQVGVSIRNVRAYARVHDLCAAPPAVACHAVAEEHVCELNCGGVSNGCYCDQQCDFYGDCCSVDGSASGSQYYSALAETCNFIAD